MTWDLGITHILSQTKDSLLWLNEEDQGSCCGARLPCVSWLSSPTNVLIWPYLSLYVFLGTVSSFFLLALLLYSFLDSYISLSFLLPSFPFLSFPPTFPLPPVMYTDMLSYAVMILCFNLETDGVAGGSCQTGWIHLWVGTETMWWGWGGWTGGLT